jgi:amino acid transporter
MTSAISSAPEPRLRRALTTPKITFLVVAAAAPLTTVVGTVPLAFALGNGPGHPAVFLFAGITLLCFSVGYAAMSRHVVNAGGFYTYLSSGLGKPVAVAGGAIAVIAYPAAAIGVLGAFGYFTQLVAAAHGLDLPWEVWAAIGAVVMGVLGYRQIDLSAKVLSIFILAEVSLLIVLDIGMLAHHGSASLPATSFSPHTVLSAGVGVSMMFALMSYIGFESAALYGEESATPERSVPLATYASVILITVFYTLTTWAAVGAIGADRVQPVAGQQLGDLFFTLSSQNVGSAATTVLQVFMCTSLFAAMLALHNAGNRYIFALGREGVLPRALGTVHRRHGSPHRASAIQMVVTVVLVAAFAIAGLDPYVNLSTSMAGLGTLGIIVLQAGAAVSVVPFFWRHRERHWWRTVLAPMLGAAGLVTAAVLLVRNFAVMTGTTNPVVTALPWLLLAAAVAGLGYALLIRAARPDVYRGLATVPTQDSRDNEPVGSRTAVQ